MPPVGFGSLALDVTCVLLLLVRVRGRPSVGVEDRRRGMARQVVLRLMVLWLLTARLPVSLTTKN